MVLQSNRICVYGDQRLKSRRMPQRWSRGDDDLGSTSERTVMRVRQVSLLSGSAILVAVILSMVLAGAGHQVSGQTYNNSQCPANGTACPSCNDTNYVYWCKFPPTTGAPGLCTDAPVGHCIQYQQDCGDFINCYDGTDEGPCTSRAYCQSTS